MKIGIYMDTGAEGTPLGGTEYSAAVLAEELSRRHPVDLITHRKSAEKSEYYRLFGTDLDAVNARYLERKPLTFGTSRWPAKRLSQAKAWHAEASLGYDFFIAFIHLIPPHCHAKQGMFTILFPFVDRGQTWPWKADEESERRSVPRRWMRKRYYDTEWKQRIDSYAIKTANSHFTAQWVKQRYDAQCQVHYPPSQAPSSGGRKKDLILSVGRFSTNKNQIDMAGAFAGLGGLAAAGWEYHTVGAVDDTHPIGRLYYDSLRSLEVPGLKVIANLELPKLKGLYQEAKLFWHAAGYPYDETRVPHVMEHFGIVTVEAMAAGCVPLVINKGGQPEIVEHGVNGFLWNTLDELRGYTLLLARDVELRARMAAAAAERARLFGTQAYIQKLYEFAPHLR
jgi:glycosyltransferase involved in cell wall biosynthesis